MSAWPDMMDALEHVPRHPDVRIVSGGPLVGFDTVLCRTDGPTTWYVLGDTVVDRLRRGAAWRLKRPDGAELVSGSLSGIPVEAWGRGHDHMAVRWMLDRRGQQSLMTWTTELGLDPLAPGSNPPRSAAR